MTASLDEFSDTVMEHFTADGGERASAAVREYFAPGKFTGSQFELLVDRDQPDRITAADIVAVSTLSVDIPADVSIWLLSEEGREAVSAHLAKVPVGVDIGAEPELLAPGGHLHQLWNLLGTARWPAFNPANGMGITKISKILAAKRPMLVPILDSVVRNALPTPERYWDAFAHLLEDSDRRDEIERVTADAPPHVSLLRRVDVVLWMAHRHRSSSTDLAKGGTGEEPA